MIVNIVVFGDTVNCLVIQPYYINANSPFNSKVRNILLDYSSKWFYAFLSSGYYPDRKAVAISPHAILPKEFLSLESLHHSLVKITTGYWDLTKTLYTSGLLPPPSLNKAKFDEMISRWKDPMQLGIESCSVDNILSFQGQDYGLVFNNLIGDRPGSGLHILKELFDVPEPTHHDVYYIKSRALKKLLRPLKKALVKCNKRFEFVISTRAFLYRSLGGKL